MDLGTIVICVVLAIICVIAVISYVKKLKNGCCGAQGDEVKRIKPKDKDISHYAYLKRVAIEGMHCKNCALRVENAFNERDDCYASVNLKQNCAIIRSKNQLDDMEIRRTVERAGYDVKAIEEYRE